MNLNEAKIRDADGQPESLIDPKASSIDGKTHALFRDLENEIINRIREADVIVGCVAWLTNGAILRELSKKQSVAIVIQKEDFLRPDLDVGSNWKQELRESYEALKCVFERYDEALKGTALHFMSSCGDPGIDPIRCVGNFNKDKKPAFPRAHHKFLVFCRTLPNKSVDPNSRSASFEPYAVWTGSFNLTHNAVNSLENVIVSEDKNIIRSFFEEWAQVEAISEPLNWSSEWVAPEWRIGT